MSVRVLRLGAPELRAQLQAVISVFSDFHVGVRPTNLAAKRLLRRRPEEPADFPLSNAGRRWRRTSRAKGIDFSGSRGGGQRNRRLLAVSFRILNRPSEKRAVCAQECAQTDVPKQIVG